jgi:hypothetical protein
MRASHEQQKMHAVSPAAGRAATTVLRFCYFLQSSLCVITGTILCTCPYRTIIRYILVVHTCYTQIYLMVHASWQTIQFVHFFKNVSIFLHHLLLNNKTYLV